MEDLATIFKDTVELCKAHPELVEACKKARENHKIYFASEKVDCQKNRFNEKAKIVVSKKRSFEAASCYKNQKVGVLNFANSFQPGGGVVYGARAQEESLCRCSTLYDSLVDENNVKNFYSRHFIESDELATDDIIYTPGVKVFKSDESFPKLLPESEWFDVDVLTCAAPNIWGANNDKIKISNKQLAAIHESRWRKILDVAALNECDVVILGAFGCGAFGNPPDVVAEVAKKVLEDYQYAFKTIEFAIYCNNSESKNFTAFNEVFFSKID